jgi:hypothetical protein
MDRKRRRTLLLAGTAASSALGAGCLGSTTSEDSDPGDGNDDEDDAGDGSDEGDGSDPDGETPDLDGELPEAFDRIETPLHEIGDDTCDFDNEVERDPLYLCAGIASEPSLPFEQVATTRDVLGEEGLVHEASDGDAQYLTAVLDEDDRDHLRGDDDSDYVQLFEETDFGSEAVLVVQTGWGSGSQLPHLKRIEETDRGIHAVGCHRDPCVQTDDVTARTVLARFERPETFESAVVSLTVDPETRVNVAAGEGVVTVEYE